MKSLTIDIVTKLYYKNGYWSSSFISNINFLNLFTYSLRQFFTRSFFYANFDFYIFQNKNKKCHANILRL